VGSEMCIRDRIKTLTILFHQHSPIETRLQYGFKPSEADVFPLLILENHYVFCLLHHVTEDSLVSSGSNRSVVNVMILVPVFAPGLAEDQLVIVHPVFL